MSNTKEILSRMRGVASARLAAASALAGNSHEPPVIISGFPRSGTTWLAEVLASIPGCGLLFEPLNTDTVAAARSAGFGWDNFRKPQETWSDGEAFMDDVLSARVLNNWTASR
ncbi:MAG: sulfotransferase, partial [Pseudomonadota bacterium]